MFNCYIGAIDRALMNFGTPEMDALRCDCAINTLFYNLHTKLVEDFTGLGIQDMGYPDTPHPLTLERNLRRRSPLCVICLIHFSSNLRLHHSPRSQGRRETPGNQGVQPLSPTDTDSHSHQLTCSPCSVHPQTKISREPFGSEIEKNAPRTQSGCRPEPNLRTRSR